MTTARNMPTGKKTEAITLRLSERDEQRLKLIASSAGIPTAIWVRVAVLKAIAESSLDEASFDNLSSSDFAAL